VIRRRDAPGEQKRNGTYLAYSVIGISTEVHPVTFGLITSISLDAASINT
jgi:hypothetical protein